MAEAPALQTGEGLRFGLGSALPSITSGHPTTGPRPVHTWKAALGVEGLALHGQDNQALHPTLLPPLCGPGRLQQGPGSSNRAWALISGPVEVK